MRIDPTAKSVQIIKSQPVYRISRNHAFEETISDTG